MSHLGESLPIVKQLPSHLAPAQPHLCSGHVLKAEHGYTDTTGWEESTKPELIKVGKLQRPCLTLIDLYQNTGIHVVQILAHSTEGSVGEEVNKHSLIRLHQRPSYHLGNLVMLNNSTLPPPTPPFLTGDFKAEDGLMEASLMTLNYMSHFHITKHQHPREIKQSEILHRVTFISDLLSDCYSVALCRFSAVHLITGCHYAILTH